MEFLALDLNIKEAHMWTVMSDRQKGLVDAVNGFFPGSEHRYCVMHLYSNFKQNYRGLALKGILFKASMSSRVVDLQMAMDEMKSRDDKAFQWLAQVPPCHWSRSHFSTHSKSDILYNNYSESFNSMILSARKKPILELLEHVRLILMKRLHERRDQMLKYDGVICPKIVKILEELKKRASDFFAHWNGEDQFEIENGIGTRFKVHLTEKTCSCRRWDLTGIPCVHAISGIFYLGKNPEDFVDNCYSRNTFLRSHSHMMKAINDSEMWPEVDVQPLVPPVIEKMPGNQENITEGKIQMK
ncbi:Unknown protein, partial [Striga hermonthica]